MASKRKVPPPGKPDPEPAGEQAAEPAPQPAAAPEAGPLDLEQALTASFPDLVLVDADLELSAGVRVDVVCVDSAGHALFVCAVDGEGDATVLGALDLTRGLREDRDALYRHLAHPALRADMPPLAVLVADRFSDVVLARLACLDVGALWCLEQRSIRSRTGTSVHLVLVLPEQDPVLQSPEDPTEFCRHLAPEHRDLGLTLVARLSRIDEHLEFEGMDRGVRWSLAGEAICSISARDGRLEGHVAPAAATVGIDSSEALETFVEDALGRTLELLEPDALRAESADSVREAALDPSQPILTSEEIEAFRQL